jgi:hypothetical protein
MILAPAAVARSLRIATAERFDKFLNVKRAAGYSAALFLL